MPQLSVIIPVYNGEATIATTVASVLAQSLTDFEVIIIDDGSQDATRSILATIPDPRISIWEQENRGVSASRNLGIAHSNGEYIAFLDADDVWTTDKLACQCAALQQHPDAAVAYSWTDYIDPQGQLLHAGDHPKNQGDVYSALLVKNFLENGSNPLIRKDYLLKVGLFDESLSYAEDWDLWLRLAAKFPFVVVPQAQVLYRVSSNSASAQLNNMEKQGLVVIHRAFQHCDRPLSHLKPISLSNFYFYLLLRSLQLSPTSGLTWNSLRFYYLTVKANPAILQKRGKLMMILLVKTILTSLPFRVKIRSSNV